jgi:DNA-binding transcriptional ArsR family regulator
VATRKSRSREQPRTITDPRAIRALAHPARLAVLDELQPGTELTATECARIAGMSPSAMSYHLRALEKWGFVERAGSTGDGRERPWRATSPQGWRVEASSPVATAAESTLIAAAFERLRTAFDTWTSVEPDQPKAWRDVAILGSTTAWLTPEECRELLEHYERLTATTRRRSQVDHPAAARRVRVGLVLAPQFATHGQE